MHSKQGLFVPLLSTSRTCVYDIVYENITFGAEVFAALRTTISPEWTHSLRNGGVGRRCCRKRPRAPMACWRRIGCLFQCWPTKDTSEHSSHTRGIQLTLRQMVAPGTDGDSSSPDAGSSRSSGHRCRSPLGHRTPWTGTLGRGNLDSSVRNGIRKV